MELMLRPRVIIICRKPPDQWHATSSLVHSQHGDTLERTNPRGNQSATVGVNETSDPYLARLRSSSGVQVQSHHHHPSSDPLLCMFYREIKPDNRLAQNKRLQHLGLDGVGVILSKLSVPR